MIYWVSAVFVIMLIYTMKGIIRRLTHRYPPGPIGLPIVGYSPFIGPDASRKFFNLQNKYGTVFGFYKGSRYTVVLNEFSHIKEALNKEEFANHEPIFKIDDRTNHLFNMNDREWTETRRFTLRTLRTLGIAKSNMEMAIMDELKGTIKKLEETPHDEEVDVNVLLYPPVLNFAFYIVFGKAFVQTDKILALVDKCFTELLFKFDKNLNGIFYPTFHTITTFLEKLLPSSKTYLDEMKDFVRNEVKKHEENFNENNKEDFIDFFIHEMGLENEQTTALTRTNIIGGCLAILFAGSFPATSILSWTFLWLAKYPFMQKRVYEEIVEAVGRDLPPLWSDRSRLPFTNAFIMEVARLKTTNPETDPHFSSKDGEIGCFHIPKNSIIYANVYSVHMDAKLWGDPENFRPERFLSPDGKIATNPEYWLPFLIGKRSCPGDKIAKMQIFLFVTSIVQKFLIVPPASGLSLEEKHGFLLHPAKPILSFHNRT